MLQKLLKKALSQERTMRAITGMSIQQFLELSMCIHTICLSQKKKPKCRMMGGGRKHTLKDAEAKTLFLLFYLKVYPTYDFASIIYLVDRSQICRWVKQLLPILEMALGRSLSFPKRKISSIAEFKEAFPDIHEIILDATERKSRRPRISKALTRRYSGKKKSHTRKNTVLVDRHKRIRFISPTREGKKHDLALVKKEAFSPYIPPGADVFCDKGYTGLQDLVSSKVFVHIPKKHRKKTPLTKQEREENQVINSIRISVEHAIGGMKRFGCMQTPIRNKDWKIEDLLPALCAGLWNFHLDRS